MSYPRGYLYQPPGSLALYSCPAAYGAARGGGVELLARSAAASSGSSFTPYQSSASAFSAQAASAAAAAAECFGGSLHYPGAGGDPTAGFPAYMGSPYDAHATGMTGAISYHPYGSPAYPYQLNDPAYRKNATRETTSTLKAWLQEHRKNPYPTKGEKIMLAIITKMTLTQVSTWFANARRRLKKENKVTWAPRNKSEDEDEEDGDGDGDRAKEESSDKVQESNEASAEDEGISLHVDSMTDHSCSAESDGEKLPCLEVEHLCESGSESKDKYEEDDEDDDVEVEEDQDLPSTKHFPPSPLRGMDSVLLNHHQQQREEIARTLNKTALDNAVSPSSQPQAVKPKLWSLAEIATSDHKQQTLGQSCQSTALCPPPTSTNSHGSTYSPSSILGGLIYYTSPFYSNYANYGNFNAALQSQGILRYGSAAMAAGESLGQTVITTGSAHKQGPDSLRTAGSQSEQHFRGSSYEPKKGEPVL